MAKREIRHLPPPANLKEWLYRVRFTLARRTVQFLLIVLFIGTFRFGWNFFGKPLLEGDLSGSRIFGLIPMADPFAALQRVLSQYWLSPETLLGAFLVLFFYGIVSGRAFCSWVCPMNLVTDFAYWLREKLHIKTQLFSIPSSLRYVLLVVCLVLCVLTGEAAFEALSPQGIIWREMVYGIGYGFLSAVFGILALDLGVSKRAWCGHLCPLGAFWALWGKFGLLKVAYDDNTCTRCGDCLKVCPEPQVINFNKAAIEGRFSSGECTNCGKCIAICPENSLNFKLRCCSSKKEN